jgi:hypothetical protein
MKLEVCQPDLLTYLVPSALKALRNRRFFANREISGFLVVVVVVARWAE